ncbi:MAG: polysaccharide biosynthesis tyrosine autokinase [bacterium]
MKDSATFDEHLVSIWKPDSVIAEQYRILRTYILEVSKKKESRVFQVSSAIRGEGKTLTSINLAVSIVKGMDETVLLIDADMRKPQVGKMLGLDKSCVGLAEYLTYGGDLAKYILKTLIPKLSVITAGIPPENPSELLDSDRMFNLIQEVKNRYDNRFIIIDSPPIIPVTDSTIISSLVDHVILVVRASMTQREAVYEAINKLEDKTKILGLVLNGCENSLSNYFYHRYGRYSYSYERKKTV